MRRELADPSLLVGVGASAGGLEALERFFRAMPPDTGMAFVVVQHLSPDFKSLMDELLARFTSMHIVAVSQPVRPRPNTIYLLPPSKELSMVDGQVVLVERAVEAAVPKPIDRFFEALARAWGDRAAAIVLSGTGSDGTLGVAAVHEFGGLVLVQSESTARFDGMPRSAISTGLAHGVCAPEEMIGALTRYAHNPTASARSAASSTELPERSGNFAVLFARLREIAGIEFAQYKLPTVLRRIERRMALRNFSDVDAYASFAVADPAELAALHGDLLICVTRFFRDPAAFAMLASSVIPEIVAATPAIKPVRVWVPACATGEEAYSLAFLFIRELAARGRPANLKIFATDVHAESLRVASEGLYSEDALSGLPDDVREEFFSREVDGRFRVVPRARKVVVFSPHNLLRDVPFNRVDLVSCRNALIYFETRAQARALSALLFALRLGGVLFLGPSETVGGFEEFLQPIDRGWNIFRKAGEAHSPLSLVPRELVGPARSLGPDPRLLRTYDRLLERFAPPSVLVSSKREIVHVFGAGNRFLSAPSGRPALELVAMCHEDLRVPSSLVMARAQREHQPAEIRGVTVRLGTGDTVVDVRAEPLGDKRHNDDQLLVQFIERGASAAHVPAAVPAVVEANDIAESRAAQLETELADTRASLNALVQELETTNEELQTTNEELLASNEELQSTNEELHAVNEELYSVNSEHEQKIRELAATTADLRNLMNTSHVGVIFIDEQRRIRMFTRGAVELLNLIARDIGRPITDITSRVADDNIFVDLELVEQTLQAVESELRLPDDRCVVRRIVPYRDADKQAAGFVLTFIDVTERKRIEMGEKRTLELLKAVIDGSPSHIAMVDENGTIVAANRAWTSFSRDNGGDTAHTGVGANYFVACRPHTQDPDARRAVDLITEVLQGKRETADLDYPCHAPDEERWFWMNVSRVPIGKGGAVITHTNITARTKMEATNARLAAIIESSADAIISLDERGVVTSWNPAAARMFRLAGEQAVGRSATEMIPPARADEAQDLNARVMTGESVSLFETERLRGDSTTFPVMLNCSPVLVNGRVVGMSIVATDLTARNEARARQRRLEEKLAEADRLESLGALASGVAHDFNNLLAGVIANLDFGASELPVGSRVRDALDDARKAAQLAAQLSRQMLAFSGRGTLVLERLRLDELVNGTIALVRHAFNHASLAREFDPTPLLVLGDASQLQQVLMNLLVNAAEATTERGGKITVRTSFVTTAADLESSSGSGFARVDVIDDGVGIAPEHLGKIFDPFFSTKFAGRGLGLAAAQGIVRAHGGRLEVATTTTDGAQFTLFLPVAPPASERAAVPSPASAPSPPPTIDRPRRGRVLVIDDEVFVRRALARLLERAGFACTIADDGVAGVDTFARTPDEFDLVLLDFTMPRLNGAQTLEKLRAIRPAVRAVLMSGFGESEMVARFEGHTLHGFLPKPIDSRTLLATVEQALTS